MAPRRRNARRRSPSRPRHRRLRRYRQRSCRSRLQPTPQPPLKPARPHRRCPAEHRVWARAGCTASCRTARQISCGSSGKTRRTTSHSRATEPCSWPQATRARFIAWPAIRCNRRSSRAPPCSRSQRFCRIAQDVCSSPRRIPVRSCGCRLPARNGAPTRPMSEMRNQSRPGAQSNGKRRRRPVQRSRYLRVLAIPAPRTRPGAIGATPTPIPTGPRL